MKYRKKPVVIEAIQWKENTTEIIQFCGNKCSYNANDTAWEVGKGIPNEELIIHTLEGDMIASRNDYIIKGIKGEVCPCKPDIFEKIYEEVGGMNVLEKILEEIENHAIEFESFGMCDDYVSVGWVKEIIRKHMDDATDTNDGWILVEDGLPEEHDSIFAKFKGTDMWNNAMFEKVSDEVNVTIELEDGTRKTTTSHTLDGKWKVEKECVVNKKVIAWRPLPKPYKPKKLQTEEKPVQ